MGVSLQQAVERFLEALGIYGSEQDEVDVEYLQDVHWERWEEISWRVADPDCHPLY